MQLHVDPRGGRAPVDRVDLWLARVEDAPPPAPAWLVASLSAEELARSSAFHQPADAHLFMLAHGLLRAALSHYYDHPPAAWRFVTAPGGKPGLAEPPPAPLHFNLSHAPGLVAVAFCGRGPVGVDVEPLSRAAQVRGLVATQFHPDEWPWLEAGDPAERDRRAVWLWTAHEALLKASGVGMAVPSREIAVEWGDADAPRVVVAPPGVGSHWALRPLNAGRTHLGCCAMPREGLELRTRVWVPSGAAPPAA